MFLVPLDFFEVWVLFHLKGITDPLTQHSTTPSHCPLGRENTPCGRLTVARTHSHSRNAAVTTSLSCDSTEPEPPSQQCRMRTPGWCCSSLCSAPALHQSSLVQELRHASEIQSLRGSLDLSSECSSPAPRAPMTSFWASARGGSATAPEPSPSQA